MNIGIDGYEANTLNRVGIGQYAFQLLHHMHQLDKKNSYTIFLPEKPLTDMPKTRIGWEYVVGRPGGFWTIKQLPFLIRNKQLDVFFSPTHYTPWFSNIPQVMSIMDLSYLYFPKLFKKKDLLQLRIMGGKSIRRAKRILTISEFSKNEIVKKYKIPRQNIFVTYPGLNPDFEYKNTGNENVILKKYGVNNIFILFIGTLQPRKNISRLIAAFDTIEDEKLELVIIGKKGWLYEPILAKIQKAKKKNLIRVLDFVPDELLPVFYQNAQCFTLPSLYEGFGIPVLEALHFGCPVVISNVTSLPEVAGKVAIYVNPENIQDIAKGLIKALQLKPEERKSLILEGYKQAKKFQWTTCAQKTITALEGAKNT